MSMTDFAYTVLNLLVSYGYLVLLALGFAEGIGFPVPGGIVLIVAGSLVAKGSLDFLLSYLLFGLGNFIAICVFYYVGKKGSEKWMSVVKKDPNQEAFWSKYLKGPIPQVWKDWFWSWQKKHGGLALASTQIYFRSLRLPLMIAGAAGQISFVAYLLYTTLGYLIWSIIWLGLGIYLGPRWTMIWQYTDYQWLLGAAIGVIVLVYILIRRLLRTQPE